MSVILLFSHFFLPPFPCSSSPFPSTLFSTSATLSLCQEAFVNPKDHQGINSNAIASGILYSSSSSGNTAVPVSTSSVLGSQTRFTTLTVCPVDE